jgi:hypothetical protein
MTVRKLGTDILKTFLWTYKDNKPGVGSIAQLWLPIFPELVGGSESEFYDLNYSKSGVIALQAINEHILIYEHDLSEIKNRINKNESEIERLSGEVKNLRSLLI